MLGVVAQALYEASKTYYGQTSPLIGPYSTDCLSAILALLFIAGAWAISTLLPWPKVSQRRVTAIGLILAVLAYALYYYSATSDNISGLIIFIVIALIAVFFVIIGTVQSERREKPVE